MAQTTLIIGGARSGKSSYAEAMAQPFATPAYIATAEALDAEMSSRIALHQARRGGHWRNYEEPIALAKALRQASREAEFILVDCLTLWISNLLLAEHDLPAAVDGVVALVPELAVPVVFVSNEVGQGIVPDNALARQFRDAAGLANQQFAACCERVVLLNAGLPLVLKGNV